MSLLKPFTGHTTEDSLKDGVELHCIDCRKPSPGYKCLTQGGAHLCFECLTLHLNFGCQPKNPETMREI
jgi:hypothetical protein